LCTLLCRRRCNTVANAYAVNANANSNANAEVAQWLAMQDGWQPQLQWTVVARLQWTSAAGM
jgi:hypothetical protein